MSFENYDFIRFDREGRILTMTLNRPEKLNAVNGQMHSELVRAFMEVQSDLESDVLIVTGAGRGFCSGGDVSGMTSPAGTNVQRRPAEVQDEGRRLIEALMWVEKPIVAMVNGPATGLGATLALFCDIVVASKAAVIGDTHVSVGLVAGDGGAVMWPLLVGPARAKEYLMTGTLLKAEEAERIGLVNHVVDPDSLRATTLGIAQTLARMPQYALRATKVSINRHIRRAMFETLDVSLAYETLSMSTEEHHRAASAFVGRRKNRLND